MLRRGVAVAVALAGFVGVTAGLLVAFTGNGGASPARSGADKICDRYAATTGKDRAKGTREKPFRTVPRLLASLRPGETGCLLGGVFEQDQIIVRRGGRPGQPIRLRSAPGTRATIKGRITINGDVSDVVFSGLDLDGRNSIGGASPTVLGDRIVFRNNDVTNENTEICFILGSPTRGYAAEGTVIDGNRVHNCGKLPPQNGDHGIYVAYARDTQITNNYIYDNADRGIQLYPDADGTLIANNVIDSNGEGIIFSGSETAVSDNNVVRDNIISNSIVRYNVEYFYPEGGPLGQGNVVTRNCIFGGAEGNEISGDGIAFVASENQTVDPGFVDRAAKDFTLRPDSPCLSAAPKRLPPPVQPSN